MILGMYGEGTRVKLAEELAGAFCTGAWNETALAERGSGCLDRWPWWMAALTMRLCALYPTAPLPYEAANAIRAFLAEQPDDPKGPPAIIRFTLSDAPDAASPGVGPRRDGPAPVRARLRHRWPIAAVDSVPELAERLELSLGQLAWLADTREMERTVERERLRNYRYATLPRRAGPPRVIEMPKARLKEIQRWMLREILDKIPPHAAAHGFVPGRSVRTHAALHTGRPLVRHFDLRDFFASVTAGRVYGTLLTVGYRPAVAHVLTGLATNVVPGAVWRAVPPSTTAATVPAHFALGRRLATPHLPQGAPCSPALANLAAFRLDRRLSGLAAATGLRYSRYADDLVFSGPAGGGALAEQVATIALEEGFALHPAKTRVSSQAQRQSVCGVVVNARTNAPRAEYDRLRAILHDAARRGPAAANRAGVADFAAHLRGRIAWVGALNPARGMKLLRAFDAVDWRAQARDP